MSPFPAATIGHVHLKVSDLERAERFYREILGLRVTERAGQKYSFLSAGTLHHDVALQERPFARHAPRDALGLYHAAFEVQAEHELAALRERLDACGVPYREVDRGISKAVYFEDPDANGLEVYLDTRHRRKLWGGRDEPL